MAKILLIEDDKTIVEGLSVVAEYHGYSLFSVSTGEEGLRLFKESTPDLVVLDIMLPGIDGFQVCKEIRKANKILPIIMLTAKGQESDKLYGFEMGADDYVTKPFSAKELMARIKVNLKRFDLNNRNPEVVKIGDAIIDFNKFTIKKRCNQFALSPKEHDILKFLVNYPNRVNSRDKIIDGVWGGEYFPNPKTIDNFIHKLRSKLEDDPQNPKFIISVHGAGYMLKKSEDHH